MKKAHFVLIILMMFAWGQEDLSLNLPSYDVVRFCAFTYGITCGQFDNAGQSGDADGFSAFNLLPSGGTVLFSRSGGTHNAYMYIAFDMTGEETERLMADYINELLAENKGWVRFGSPDDEPEDLLLCRFPKEGPALSGFRYNPTYMEGRRDEISVEVRTVVELNLGDFVTAQACQMLKMQNAESF